MTAKRAALPIGNSLYSVTELGKELGVSARTIRFYEDKGLLSPSRVGNNRVYAARDRARMILILRGKQLGFSLREIKEYLDLYDCRSNTRKTNPSSVEDGPRQDSFIGGTAGCAESDAPRAARRRSPGTQRAGPSWKAARAAPRANLQVTSFASSGRGARIPPE